MRLPHQPGDLGPEPDGLGPEPDGLGGAAVRAGPMEPRCGTTTAAAPSAAVRAGVQRGLLPAADPALAVEQHERWQEDKRLKALEDENRRLKKLLAEQLLDNAALKDLVGKNF